MSDTNIIDGPWGKAEKSPLRRRAPDLALLSGGLERLFNAKLTPNGVDVDLDRDLAAHLNHGARQLRMMGDDCLLCRRPSYRKELVEFAERMEHLAIQITMENSIAD